MYSLADTSGATTTAVVTIEISGESDTTGDFDGDTIIDAADVDLLCRAINVGGFNAAFDIDGSGVVSLADLDELIQNILETTFGDANLDRVFNSSELIQVFQIGQYQDGLEDNSTWTGGDWNCDR